MGIRRVAVLTWSRLMMRVDNISGTYTSGMDKFSGKVQRVHMELGGKLLSSLRSEIQVLKRLQSASRHEWQNVHRNSTVRMTGSPQNDRKSTVRMTESPPKVHSKSTVSCDVLLSFVDWTTLKAKSYWTLNMTGLKPSNFCWFPAFSCCICS